MARDPRSPIPVQPEPFSTAGLPSASPPFLPLHTAVVLLTAAFFGVVMGGLMLPSLQAWPPQESAPWRSEG